jgi:hypothetical protein
MKNLPLTPEHHMYQYIYRGKKGYPYSFFFNGKKVTEKKLKVILENNVGKKQLFIREKRVKLPFYKGDYTYFHNNYDVKGWKRITHKKYYITTE